MEKIRKNKKPLIFLLILLILGIVGYTIAYYYSEADFVNNFKSMTYSITLKEDFNNDWGIKKVYITNENVETNVPVVLRLNYNETWSDKKSTESILSNEIEGVDAATKNWTSTFTNNFFLAEDGWYYYEKVLDKGETIQILESIAKNDAAINQSPYKTEYQSYDYNLSFNYEAIQANEEAVQEIWGKTVTINGSDVEWE